MKFRFFAFLPLFLSLPAWAQSPVTVHVVDEKNVPVEGAIVEIQAWSTNKAPLPAPATDAQGTTIISLSAKPDPKRVISNLAVYAKGFGFAGVPVNGSAIEVHLKQGALWSGQILDEAGKPVPAVQVRVNGAMNQDGWQSRISVFGARILPHYETRTDAEGKFQIEDLPAGMQVTYSVEHPKYAIVGGRASLTEEEKIRLAPAGALSGRLTDVNGKPLGHIGVYASPVTFGQGGNDGLTGDDGTFQIASLKPGLYKLGVQAEFFGPNPKFVFPNISDLQIKAGKTLDVAEVRAVPGVEVHGVVLDSVSRKPVPGVSINAMQKHDSSGSATTDATGNFSMRVLPGIHHVYVAGTPEGYVTPQTQQTVDASKTDAALPASELTFELRKAVVIHGTTVDEAGKPIVAQLSFGIMDGTVTSDVAGHWEYTPGDDAGLLIMGGNDESGYFEILGPQTYQPPYADPLRVRVRKLPWLKLSGRVMDSDGTPLSGVKISGTFMIPLGAGMSTSQKRSAVSDAQGHFVLQKMRDSKDVTVSGQKEGFTFRSGGEVSKVGADWAATELIFAALNRQIEGTTAPGATVMAAGRETLADATGHFLLSGLPTGVTTVFAAQDGKFGQTSMTATAGPVNIDLKPQGLQGVDVDLGHQIWSQTAADPASAKYYALTWLQTSGRPELADTFEAVRLAAKELPSPNHDWQLSSQVEKWAPKLPAQSRVEALDEVIHGISIPEIALTAWLSSAISSDDPAVGRQAIDVVAEVFNKQMPDSDWREWNLYRLAVVTEKVEGEKAGSAALDRAIIWTMKHHALSSFKEDGAYIGDGRDEYMKLGAHTVAQGPDALLHQLIAAIDPESGYDVQALGEAIPVVAKVRGADAAMPLLNELIKMPALPRQEGRRSMNVDPNWAFGQAARRVIPLLGEKSPQKALELARRVTSEDQRARALAAAARCQVGAEAETLWREAMAAASAEEAPRFAAAAWETDPKLGRELFEIARQKVSSAMGQPYTQGDLWADFAFYFARVDAAQSRLILERQWALAQEKKESGGSAARAMSAIDANRADEMARQIADKEFASPEIRRKIGQYLIASDELRRDLPFDRWGASDTWSPGDDEW